MLVLSLSGKRLLEHGTPSMRFYRNTRFLPALADIVLLTCAR